MGLVLFEHVELHLSRAGNPVIEHSTHYPKIVGSNPARIIHEQAQSSSWMKEEKTTYLEGVNAISQNGSELKTHRERETGILKVFFLLRSKCSICSYQLNIWYEDHVSSSILNWFLNGDGVLSACTGSVASRPCIAVPQGTAHRINK